MSLLSDAKKEAKIETPAQVAGTEVAEATPAKKHNNSDYQKRQREHQYSAACKIRDFLKEKKITLPEDLQAEMDFLTREKKAGGNSAAFGKPVIYKIFGNTPKVGDKVTAMKVFENTGKGFAEMRQLMKKWEKNGITVAFDEASKSYVIKAGNIDAYVEA